MLTIQVADGFLPSQLVEAFLVDHEPSSRQTLDEGPSCTNPETHRKEHLVLNGINTSFSQTSEGMTTPSAKSNGPGHWVTVTGKKWFHCVRYLKPVYNVIRSIASSSFVTIKAILNIVSKGY